MDYVSAYPPETVGYEERHIAALLVICRTQGKSLRQLRQETSSDSKEKALGYAARQTLEEFKRVYQHARSRGTGSKARDRDIPKGNAFHGWSKPWFEMGIEALIQCDHFLALCFLEEAARRDEELEQEFTVEDQGEDEESESETAIQDEALKREERERKALRARYWAQRRQQRARTLRLLGELRWSLGDKLAAVECLERALLSAPALSAVNRPTRRRLAAWARKKWAAKFHQEDEEEERREKERRHEVRLHQKAEALLTRHTRRRKELIFTAWADHSQHTARERAPGEKRAVIRRRMTARPSLDLKAAVGSAFLPKGERSERIETRRSTARSMVHYALSMPPPAGDGVRDGSAEVSEGSVYPAWRFVTETFERLALFDERAEKGRAAM